jgi:hypothetical protein
LRKLTTQKREDHGEDDRVGEGRGEAGLTGAEDATRTRGEGEKETRAESKEERGGHEEVGLGEHETHRARDEAVHEEEDESVEEDGHLAGLSVHELDVLARGGHENTGAEREKKGGRDGNFLRGDIGEHLVYAHIIFREIYKVVECCTSHHLFMKTIVINDSPDVSPDVIQLIVKLASLTFVIWIVFCVTKIDKVAEFP